MKYGLTKAAIEKICAVFARFREIEKAVLYGSRAKGNFKPGSDIDLTLYGEALTSDLRSAIASALDDLLLPYTIDLSVFDDLDHVKLREHIERVGVVFYERESAGEHQGAAMKKGWQTKTLGEVLEKTETVNPLQSPNVEFDYIDVSSVSNTTFEIETTQRLKGKDAPSRARKLVRTNDIIFATIRPTLQRIAVVPEDLDQQVCSTGYFVLRPKQGIDHRFVFYSLFTEDFIGQMESLQKGASYPAVTDGDVRAQVIPIPPLAEQQRIVGVLDEAFAGIATAKANAEKNLKNARALFESHLQSVFTQRGKSVRAGWHETKLAELADVQSGAGFPIKFQGKGKGGIPFYKVSDMNIEGNERDMVHENNSITEEVRKKLGASLFPKGSVIFPKIGGAIATNKKRLTTRDCCVDNNVMGAIPKPGKMTSEFLYYFFLAYNLSDFANEAHLPSIKKTTVEEWELCVPKTITEQERIVAELHSFTKETQRLAHLYSRKLAALEALKKSLLHQAFTGEL